MAKKGFILCVIIVLLSSQNLVFSHKCAEDNIECHEKSKYTKGMKIKYKIGLAAKRNY
jgi:hypothetical protein